MGERKNSYESLIRKPEGKRLFGRSRRRWKDYVKVVIREIVSKGADWIHLAQERN
jgi:hypothetical protein